MAPPLTLQPPQSQELPEGGALGTVSQTELLERQSLIRTEVEVAPCSPLRCYRAAPAPNGEKLR